MYEEHKGVPPPPKRRRRYVSDSSDEGAATDDGAASKTNVHESVKPPRDATEPSLLRATLTPRRAAKLSTPSEAPSNRHPTATPTRRPQTSPLPMAAQSRTGATSPHRPLLAKPPVRCASPAG